MRVRRLLEYSTDATVSCTIRYPDFGFNPRNWIDAPSNCAEILTNPPFANDGESANHVSVNLRWILANQLFAASNRNGDYTKTLFLSFHADSLHPSARGTMVYVPSAAGVPASFALPYTGVVPINRLGPKSRITFTATERLQSEARSRMFAESLLGALTDEGIPTHVNRPIRNAVLRNGKSFIPAVIRYSSAATKVLLEVLNLTNRDDADNLKNHIFRERYAQAIVKGIKTHYRN
jgi:N-acetylmuramoyl-L-alanine amidase